MRELAYFFLNKNSTYFPSGHFPFTKVYPLSSHWRKDQKLLLWLNYTCPDVSSMIVNLSHLSKNDPGTSFWLVVHSTITIVFRFVRSWTEKLTLSISDQQRVKILTNVFFRSNMSTKYTNHNTLVLGKLLKNKINELSSRNNEMISLMKRKVNKHYPIHHNPTTLKEC